jgi:hypothetical protein
LVVIVSLQTLTNQARLATRPGFFWLRHIAAATATGQRTVTQKRPVAYTGKTIKGVGYLTAARVPT